MQRLLSRLTGGSNHGVWQIITSGKLSSSALTIVSICHCNILYLLGSSGHIMSCMAAWKIDLVDGRADPGSRRFGSKLGWGACGSFSWCYLQHITNQASYLYCIPTILIIPETSGTSHRRTRFRTESIEATVSHAFVRSRCRNASLLRPPFPLAPWTRLLSRRPDLPFPLPSVNCTIPNTC